jgi:DNA-binding transcriptional ArsR family regulator
MPSRPLKVKHSLDYRPPARILKQVPNQLSPLDQVFHALADPTRRGMVERLVRGPATVSELSRPLDMSLPAVLQHLQVLEASGLVRSEKAGRVRTCRIEPDALRAAEAWVTGQRTAWETRLDRLGDYLAGHGADSQNTDSQTTDSQKGS